AVPRPAAGALRLSLRRLRAPGTSGRMVGARRGRGDRHMTGHRAETDSARTRRAQRDAADPRASVWVSANAGTGKTHVLVQRVLRLLLAGTKPHRILCLTSTT